MYLAAAEAPEAPSAPTARGEHHDDSATGHDRADASTAAPALVVMRVYDADVPGETLAREIDAMSTDATGTLPALLDVATLDGGRCCLVVDRLGGPALSRIIAERTISPGEAVTILAPIVVAVAELARNGFVHGRLAPSDVLLDDAGRPRLVGLGALQRLPQHAPERVALLRSGHAALADLMEEVASAVVPARALADPIALLHERLAARPFVPCEGELERRLFAAATPEPVRGIEVRASPRRLPARVTAPLPHDAALVDATAAPAPGRGVIGEGLRRMLALVQGPEDLVDRVATAADVDRAERGRRRLVAAARGRGRSLVFGGLVGGAALVAMLTLVPPATAEDVPARRRRPRAPRAANRRRRTGADRAPRLRTRRWSSPRGERVPSSRRPTRRRSSPTRIPSRRLGDCSSTGRSASRRSISAASTRSPSPDRPSRHPIAWRSRRREMAAEVPVTRFDPATIEVVAEMGAAVLVRAATAPGREPASLLMVRGEAGWRLREVFD